jgi:hypothetical protein
MRLGRTPRLAQAIALARVLRNGNGLSIEQLVRVTSLGDLKGNARVHRALP